MFSNFSFVLAVEKGRGANLMKSDTKRKRGKKQIEEDKQEEQAEKMQAQIDAAELVALRAKVRSLEASSKKGKQAASIVNQMIAEGLVQQDAEDSIILQGNDGGQKRVQADPIDSDDEFVEMQG